MVNINLVPEKDRLSNDTPCHIAVIAVSAVIALFSLTLYLSYFKQLQQTQRDFNQVAEQCRQLQSQGIEQKHREVKNLLQVLNTHETAIAEVHLMHSQLARKLNGFSQLFQDNAVWINSLNIAMQKNKSLRVRKRKSQKAVASQAPTYQWQAPCESAGKKLEIAIKFHRDIMHKGEFFKDFTSIETPIYNRITFPEGYSEEIGYSFPLAMNMSLQR